MKNIELISKIIDAVRTNKQIQSDIPIDVEVVLNKLEIFERIEQHVHMFKTQHGYSTLWSDSDPDEPNTRIYAVIENDSLVLLESIDALLRYLTNYATIFQIDIEDGLD